VKSQEKLRDYFNEDNRLMINLINDINEIESDLRSSNRLQCSST